MTYNPSRSSAVGVLAGRLVIAMSAEDDGRDDSSMSDCLLSGESAGSTNEGWSLAGRFLFKDVVDGLPGASDMTVKNRGLQSMADVENNLSGLVEQPSSDSPISKLTRDIVVLATTISMRCLVPGQ